MIPLVTIAVPVYKRLEYLPGALRSIAAQTHGEIDLLVSDNGEQGAAIEAIVAEHYPRPHRVRHNPRSVSIVEHFNQLVAEARGTYFALLSDDDEISPTFAAELAGLLERNPQAAVALARVEVFSEDGSTILGSTDDKPLPPERMPGMSFLAAWAANTHKFLSFTTNLSRTDEVRALGGYPDFDRANGSDNALLVKQVIGRELAFSPRCTFRHRIHETSYGKAASMDSLALASRQFLRFLVRDQRLVALRRLDRAQYAKLRGHVTHIIYNTYLSRWRRLYRSRLSRGEWLRAGFALPPHPVYTRQALATVAAELPLLSTLVRARTPRGAR